MNRIISSIPHLTAIAARALVTYADEDQPTRRVERTWALACFIVMLAAAVIGISPTIASLLFVAAAATAATWVVTRLQR